MIHREHVTISFDQPLPLQMRSAVHYAVHRPNCAIDVGKLDLRPRQRQVDTALTFGVDSAIAKQPECTRPRPLPFSSCTSAPSSALYLSFSAVSSTSAMNADVSFRSPTGSTTADYTRRNNHLQLHIEQPCRPALIHLILTVLVLATSPLSTLASTCADGIPASGVIPSDWPTRSFTLVISAATIATSDGGTKQAIAVNGSIPGPRLDANAYELLSITVVNQLNNVTGIHCHGLSFFSTPHLDGVPGLTQCGIPVGGSMTYTMCAMPSGTFWYHGHMDLQYVDGLYGALVIRSPNSSALTNPSLYQHDWVWQVADFYNLDSRYVLLPWFMSPASGGQEPQPDSLVVNGVFSSTSHLYAASTDRAIIRLINSGSLCMFYFAIDGVPLTVVELDGTEVYPYTVGSVMLNVAQRAVVTVSFADLASRYLSLDAVYYRVTMVPDADLTVDPYTAPFAVNFTQFDNWTGTLHINSPQSTSLPSYSTNSNDAPTLPPNTASQVEMNMLDARPVTYGSLRSGATVGSVPAATHSLSLEVVFANDASGVNLAYINDVTSAQQHAYHSMQTYEVRSQCLLTPSNCYVSLYVQLQHVYYDRHRPNGQHGHHRQHDATSLHSLLLTQLVADTRPILLRHHWRRSRQLRHPIPSRSRRHHTQH